MRVPTLIADDEPVARAGLRDMLGEIDWVQCIAETGNGPSTVEAINRLRPELVFLDIQMPGLLGTEVVGRLAYQPYIVFTTAHGQHATTAFALGALDYLLKPFGPERLAAAMQRVRAAFGEPSPVSALDRLTEALRNGPMSRLFVRSGQAIIPVAVADVLWFEALGDYVAAHTPRGKYVLHLALSRLEARLDSARFVRVHRTSIVNLDHVVAFRRGAGGQLFAEMPGGTRLAVSRARASELRSLAR